LRAKNFLTAILILLITYIPANGEESNPIIDYFIIYYPSISPNGDGIKDSTPIKVHIPSPCNTVAVTVEDTLLTTVFDTLFSISTPDTGEYTFSWDGTDSSGTLLPEDRYIIHLHAENDTTTTDEYREMVVDTTCPSITLERIEPGIYLPGMEGKEERVIFYYSLSNIGPGDSITITMKYPDLTEEVLLIDRKTSGNHAMEWSGDETLADGYYTITIRADDEAGNYGQDSGQFEVDTKAPDISFTTEVPERTNNPPKTICGWCYDRNGIDGPTFTWKNIYQIQPDTIYSENDTLFWRVDIEDSVLSGGIPIEGAYELGVSCADTFGHSSEESISFHIDITAPPPPTLYSLPARVIDKEIDISGISDKDRADYISLYHIVGNDTSIATKKLVVSEFTFSVELTEGDNTFWAIAEDEAGNMSTPSNTVRVEYRISNELRVPEVFREVDYFRVYSQSQINSVTVEIFTVNGEHVRKLSSNGPSQRIDIPWDLKNDDGKPVNNGPYLVIFRIEYSGRTSIEKRLIAVVR